MRIAALDYGTKRIGVAFSDTGEVIAQPWGFLAAEPAADFFQQLLALLAEKQAELIVVGMPRNLDGSYGHAATKVRDFVAALQSLVNIPVKTWDERLTSVEAHRVMRAAGVKSARRKTTVDQIAAALLLQSYLDFRHLNKPGWNTSNSN